MKKKQNNTNVERYDVAIVGLGYVGLTLGIALAKEGLNVVGIEKRKDIVELTNKGVPHFSEFGIEEALQDVLSKGTFKALESLESLFFLCDVYVLTVGTPLDASGKARLDMIINASKEVATHIQDDALVILRSTVKIGTTENVVKPVLSSSGKSFHLAMCPERTLEGNALSELKKLPQIIGSDSKEALNKAYNLFNYLTDTIVRVPNYRTAEMIKLVDNTYRDLRFAFSNEVARLSEVFGVNVMDVINYGKLGYSRTNLALPGLVGGPCLEKDPHILCQSAAEKGITLEITSAARLVNERQPEETVHFISNEMKRRELAESVVISFMGLAFKGVPATDDLRGAMSLKVIEQIKLRCPNAKIRVFDPVIASETLSLSFPSFDVANTIEEAIASVGVLILTNNHPVISSLSLFKLKTGMLENGFIFDYWNHYNHLASQTPFYFSVGNTVAR